ncbi:MAG: hypothetical protein ACYDCK_07000 [Thermoplasmatota archaeon]
MPLVTSLRELKTRIQSTFEGNEENLEQFGESKSPALKTYLIETNVALDSIQPLAAGWRKIDSSGWFAATHPHFDGSLFVDAVDARVWRVFSLSTAGESDELVKKWVSETRGLDFCWLPRNLLLKWEGLPGWSQRGVGMSFDDGLTPEDEAARFSLKAWHGRRQLLPALDDLLAAAQQKFAIYSARWQKREGGDAVLSAEVYSNGKITFGKTRTAEDALTFSSFIADQYETALRRATTARDTTLAAFELEFAQQIDLDAFSETVAKAKQPMRLWLTETEHEEDFRRFRGVDLHTWDRILLDLGPDYAYLNIPGDGCVNAAPRIATLQGEDNAGRTEIFHDGVEVFA